MISLPILFALAASLVRADDDFNATENCEGTLKCHQYCGGMARDARECGPDQSTYDGPYNHSCLCDSDSEFMSLYPDCMQCGWALWADYGPYITSALEECSLLTEPTGPSCNEDGTVASSSDSNDSSDETTTTTNETTSTSDETASTTDRTTSTSVEETTSSAQATSSTDAPDSSTESTEGTTSKTDTNTENTKTSTELTSSETASSKSTETSVSTYSGAGVKLTLSSGLLAFVCALLI